MSDPKKDIIEFLKVLANQTRLEILDLLYRQKKPASEIQTALNKSQSTISQHLKVLYTKNLIVFDKINNVKYYQVKNKEIFKLLLEIQTYVDGINKERLQSMNAEDIIDTLL